MPGLQQWEMDERAVGVCIRRETPTHSPSLKPAPGEGEGGTGPLSSLVKGPGAAAEL